MSSTGPSELRSNWSHEGVKWAVFIWSDARWNMSHISQKAWFVCSGWGSEALWICGQLHLGTSGRGTQKRKPRAAHRTAEQWSGPLHHVSPWSLRSPSPTNTHSHTHSWTSPLEKLSSFMGRLQSSRFLHVERQSVSPVPLSDNYQQQEADTVFLYWITLNIFKSHFNQNYKAELLHQVDVNFYTLYIWACWIQELLTKKYTF